MLYTVCFYCLNTGFVEGANTINICLILLKFTVLFL
jgi:hypothetical protein